MLGAAEYIRAVDRQTPVHACTAPSMQRNSSLNRATHLCV